MLSRMMKHLENVRKNPKRMHLMQNPGKNTAAKHRLRVAAIAWWLSMHLSIQTLVCMLLTLAQLTHINGNSAITNSPLLSSFSCLSYWFSHFGLSCTAVLLSSGEVAQWGLLLSARCICLASLHVGNLWSVIMQRFESIYVVVGWRGRSLRMSRYSLLAFHPFL